MVNTLNGNDLPVDHITAHTGEVAVQAPKLVQVRGITVNPNIMKKGAQTKSTSVENRDFIDRPFSSW
jgi:hypothetical protein